MASVRKAKGKAPLAAWGFKPVGTSNAVTEGARVSTAVKNVSKHVKGAMKRALSPSGSEDEIVGRGKAASKRRARASTVGDRPKAAPALQAAIKYDDEGRPDGVGSSTTFLYQRGANARGQGLFKNLSPKD